MTTTKVLVPGPDGKSVRLDHTPDPNFSHVLDGMRRNGVPLTRENYIARLGIEESEIDAELAGTFPEMFRHGTDTLVFGRRRCRRLA